MKQGPSKPNGIKEIAEALNISIGTVDRALHARAGVSAETRERVLQTAERLNYRANVAARNLKLNRNVRRLHCFTIPFAKASARRRVLPWVCGSKSTFGAIRGLARRISDSLTTIWRKGTTALSWRLGAHVAWIRFCAG
jgi:hypothetical protein